MRARSIATLVVIGAASASCLGANPPDDDIDSLVARAPDRGRTAVDPAVPGVLTLTFDDGPGPYTKDIIDILERHRAPATFFVVGRAIAGHRDVLDYARQRGHQIANHSFHHELQTLLTERRFKHGIRATHRNIDGRDEGRLYFRFPYGAADDIHLRWLSEIDLEGRRYQPVGWHTDSQDTEYNVAYPEAERSVTVMTGEDAACDGQQNPFERDMLGWTQFTARKHRGGIMLFHDTTRITRDKLDAILTAFTSPERYWATLPAELQASYGRFYDCAGVDRHFRFAFQPMYDGTYPSLRMSP